MRVDSWELPLSAILLCQLLPCHPGPPRPMLSNQPVCHRLSWLHHWSVSHVYTSRAFSPSEWGPDPQCQAVQVTHWTWWWQCLAFWHCRSVWSLPCHSAAELGALALSMAKSPWHGALRSAHKSCTRSQMSWKRGGGKRELVAAPWTSSRLFSHVVVESSQPPVAESMSLGSKRKLRPPACQVQFGLPCVVCPPRGVQFPGTVYICNQGPLSSAWADCISCAPTQLAFYVNLHRAVIGPSATLTGRWRPDIDLRRMLTG